MRVPTHRQGFAWSEPLSSTEGVSIHTFLSCLYDVYMLRARDKRRGEAYDRNYTSKKGQTVTKRNVDFP